MFKNRHNCKPHNELKSVNTVLIFASCSIKICRSLHGQSMHLFVNKTLATVSNPYSVNSTAKQFSGFLFYPFFNNITIYIEDITLWCKHMKFVFKWKKLCSLMTCFFHKKINFICSSQHVIFLLHRYECFEKKKQKTKKKQKNDVSDIFTSEDMENISLVTRM